MLETRRPPNSTRTRRMTATPGPTAPRASSAASVTRPRFVGNTALGEAQTAPKSAPHTASRPVSKPRPSRLGRSEMRLMGVATVCTAVVCGLLLLYLAAYAQVTRLGIAQAQARADLRDNRLKNMMLRAECDGLESPQHVIKAATLLGMTPRGSIPIRYIAAPGVSNHGANSDWNGGERGTNGGTTADSSAATSFNH